MTHCDAAITPLALAMHAPHPTQCTAPHLAHVATLCVQDKLWSGLKDVCESMQSAVTAVWHLQRVVAKKKDPLTHVCFLDVLVGPDEPLLTTKFW